jgi:hypothetical protein
LSNIDLLLLHKSIQERQEATRFVMLMGGFALTALTVVILFLQLEQMLNRLNKEFLHKPASVIMQAPTPAPSQTPSLLNIKEVHVDTLTMSALSNSEKIPVLNNAPLRNTQPRKAQPRKAQPRKLQQKFINELCPQGYRLFEPGLCLNILTNDFKRPKV